MSIYSGFPTRKQESQYNDYHYKINVLLTSRIISFLESYLNSETQLITVKDDSMKKAPSKNSFVDQAKEISLSSFCKYYMKLFKKIYMHDKNKHLEPHFSTSLQDLAVFIVNHKSQLLETKSDSVFKDNREHSVISGMSVSDGGLSELSFLDTRKGHLKQSLK